MRTAILLLSAALAAMPAFAAPKVQRATTHATLDVAVGEQDSDVDLARLTIRQDADIRLSQTWRAEISARLELSGADTGLGTLSTYSDLSRPVELSDNARIELETATLSWRDRATRVTLGKQTFAWGVLDGLQVTDRLDAVRRRDFLFTEHRPDRLARWSARLEVPAFGGKVDAAFIPDTTVSQLARPGDTFEPLAPRLRGGLPPGLVTPSAQVDRPDSPTLGLRYSRTFGANDVSVLMIHGPDTEPVIRFDGVGPELAYPERTLIGATFQRASGARIWRVELAHVPDQPVNIKPQTLPATDRADRWLGGVGLDWSFRSGLFVNAQIGIDLVASDIPLARPETDVITTLRVEKPFRNDTFRVRAEWIGSLSDGDGTVRPSVSWQVNDQWKISGGLDLVYGDREGLFGQYDRADRVWLRLSTAF